MGGPKVELEHLKIFTLLSKLPQVYLQFLFQLYLRRARSNPAFREVKVNSFISVKTLLSNDDSGRNFYDDSGRSPLAN